MYLWHLVHVLRIGTERLLSLTLDAERGIPCWDESAPEAVATTLREAELAGAAILRPVARAEWGGTSGAFADPNVYVWEVAHNPGWALRDDGTVMI